jgi:hypothetical protein
LDFTDLGRFARELLMRMTTMRRSALPLFLVWFASLSLVLAMAGCRGSVERNFEEDVVDADVDAGSAADAVAADVTSSDTSSAADAVADGSTGDTGAPTLRNIGGHVTGLVGAGLVLQNKLGDNLLVSADGPFTFATKIAEGGSFSVTVSNQPVGQTCSVTGGTGSVTTSDVTSVVVNCGTNTFTVGGNISGLTGSITLHDTGSASLPNLVITNNGDFAFNPPVTTGTTYNVTVSAQPAGQTCTLTGGLGIVTTTNVTSLVVVCKTLRAIGGSITGLAGTGLILQNNGTESLSIASSSTSYAFQTKIPEGSAYAVTIPSGSQPTNPTQTCSVGNASGNVGSADVVAPVTCTTTTFVLRVNITGLVGSVSLVNGLDTITPSAPGTFPFPTQVPSNGTYAVTVGSQPAGQRCTVTNPSGTVTTADVVLQVLCQNVFAQNFDASSALPAGWVATLIGGTGADTAWAVFTGVPDTAPNYMLASDPAHVTDDRLDSPSIGIQTTAAQITFRHFFDTENTYDGCVLEISIGGGAFQDILAAGGSFVTGGYIGPISSLFSSPIANRQAWTGTSSAYITTTANLPASAVGQNVVFRWRIGSDSSTPGGPLPGWRVDTVSVFR